MEQLSVDSVIRPRGRYTGPAVELQADAGRHRRKGHQSNI
jgi:hypothetical protein